MSVRAVNYGRPHLHETHAEFTYEARLVQDIGQADPFLAGRKGSFKRTRYTRATLGVWCTLKRSRSSRLDHVQEQLRLIGRGVAKT